MKYLTRTIIVLSLISLFNDISSEMLVPIMPLFLKSIGFTSVLIGMLEGVAEATAGLTKGYFGKLSDSLGKRMPFVRIGYALSAISKSMIAIWTVAPWVFLSRSLDRFGKGIRTGARDAVLSDETTPENKAKVFGFRQAMDTTGAAIGPALALVFLIYYPGRYRTMFLLAFIPAVIGVTLTFIIKERKKHATAKGKQSYSLSQTFSYLKTSPAGYRQLMAVLLLFALFNSSDIFLLLKIKEGVGNDQYVIGSYILYNIVYALAAFPLGHLADKIGLKKTMVAGLVLFSIVYAGFGFNSSIAGFAALFVLYGIYAAATDGVSKALVSNIVPKSESASALGTYAGLSSVALLFASTIAGLIWKYVSPAAVFYTSAAGVLVATIILATLKLKEKEPVAAK